MRKSSRLLYHFTCLSSPGSRDVVQNDSLLVRACHVSCSFAPVQKRHDLGIVRSQFAFSAVLLSMTFSMAPSCSHASPRLYFMDLLSFYLRWSPSFICSCKSACCCKHSQYSALSARTTCRSTLKSFFSHLKRFQSATTRLQASSQASNVASLTLDKPSPDTFSKVYVLRGQLRGRKPGLKEGVWFLLDSPYCTITIQCLRTGISNVVKLSLSMGKPPVIPVVSWPHPGN